MSAQKTDWKAALMLTDPLTGRWQLDLVASQFSIPSPRAWTLHVAAHGIGMTVEEDLAQADGTSLRVTFAPDFDGRDYPVQGSPVMDMISFVRRSDRVLEATAKKAGVVSMRDTTEVSVDGHALTVSFALFRGERSVAHGRAVFRRYQAVDVAKA